MFPVQDSQGNGTKFAGRSRGVVIDNQDPLAKGRIRVKHPLVGETVWINYLSSPDSFNVPNIGDLVYVECDCGKETHPIASGNVPKGTDDKPRIHKRFKRENPTNRGFASPGGHIIELDDGEGDSLGSLLGGGKPKQGVKLTSKGENACHLRDDLQSAILQGTNKGFSKINSENDKTTTKVIGAHREDVGAEKVTSLGGSYIVESGNKVLTKSSSETQLEASGQAILLLEDGKVALGKPGFELLDLLGKFEEQTIALAGEVDKIADQVDASAQASAKIVVPTAVGPSGPPTNASEFVAVSTQIATIKASVAKITAEMESLKTQLGQITAGSVVPKVFLFNPVEEGIPDDDTLSDDDFEIAEAVPMA